MKYREERPYADPEAAARKLVEIRLTEKEEMTDKCSCDKRSGCSRLGRLSRASRLR